MRDRPARRFGDKAKPILPIQTVNLVGNAINVIGQIRAAVFDVGIMGQGGFNMVETQQ